VTNPKSTAFLDTPIEYLKGVGPARAEVLKNDLQIATFGDLLLFFPFRYVDRTQFHVISDIDDDSAWIQLKARISRIQMTGSPRTQRLIVTVEDKTGSIDLVWFQGIKWVMDKISKGQEWIIFGKPVYYKDHWNIPHPELEPPRTEPLPLQETIRPIYSFTEKLKLKGLDTRGIARLMKNLLLHEKMHIPENLTEVILEDLRLISRTDAFINIHFPQNSEMLQKAQFRLKFEELFFIQLRLARQRYIRLTGLEGYTFSRIGDYLNNFYHHHLTFQLTNAQKRVIREIRGDLGSGNQMNRLLQGDVGSGKTMVALMSMLIALDNGFQACLMAPTEILANQHYQNISRMLENLNVRISLLTGSTTAVSRKRIHQELTDGTLQVLIGTHALIEEEVRFQNLGLVVIDEQHRFGVIQRAALWSKNRKPPHVLVMTATPIPRTLAMTLYGDLDTSVIDELPPGRKPVVTRHVSENQRIKVMAFLRKKIQDGTQAYIVYPLIQDSEALDMKNLLDGFQSILKEFPPPEYRIGMVHGKMKQQDKDDAMRRFRDRETQIMVATTVIEVGVDVPNASLMIIENAERFGLSQLHQLRGRVGRGNTQSWCILMTGYELSSDARTRISTMVRTNDGFEIAETDLRLRGPGDLQGTRQSGILDLKIADIVKDEKLLKFARNLANDIIREDPYLNQDKNHPLLKQLRYAAAHGQNWGLIS
jgi:ATP-dependent DNA helicase RecG